MAHKIACYRCGGSLAALSLPLSRQDECPDCQVYLHVCRMCRHYDPDVPRQCREDDAEDVVEKERLNFCDYFSPSESAFDPSQKTVADDAKQALDSLFGAADSPATPDTPDELDKLFK